MAVTTHDYTATYKGIGIETSVDFEAQYAGQGFADVRAIGAKTGLEALMLGEEAMILGGDADFSLGTAATPTVAGALTGGSLGTSAQSVIVVTLTLDGLMNASVAGGIQQAITRTNADGTTIPAVAPSQNRECDRRLDRAERPATAHPAGGGAGRG